MTIRDDFNPASRTQPCPICSKPDWCLVSREGGEMPIYAVCQRVESEHRWAGAGWLHRLRELHGHRRWRARSKELDLGGRDFADTAHQYTTQCSAARRQSLSESLGVTSRSLQRLGLGWDGRAFTFPMQDGLGRVRGIRRRFPNGKQCAVTGSRNGIFVPTGLTYTGLLLVCEGASDTAAMLDLGFEVIGRPDCGSARRTVVRYVRKHPLEAIAVVADNDLVGHQGAWSLAWALALHCPNVCVITPPKGVKDAREWVRAGGTRHDLEATIEMAVPVRLSIRARHAGGGR